MAKTIELKVPDIGDDKDVPVIELLVQPGDTVAKDQGLVTLESDKATMEVPSPFAGVVRELKVKLGDSLSEGALVALIEASAGAAPAPAPTPAAVEPPRAQPEAAQPVVASAETGAKVDIDDEGLIKISSSDPAQIEAAKNWILGIVEEPEVGKVYDGKVVTIVDFGAFVNFMGGKDGLVHVSEMKNERVEKPTDVVSEGQAVKVKVLEIDPRGKVRLSMRVVDQETGEELEDTRPAREPREPRGDRGDRGDRGRGPRRDGGDRGGRGGDRGPRRDRGPRSEGKGDDDGSNAGLPDFLTQD